MKERDETGTSDDCSTNQIQHDGGLVLIETSHSVVHSFIHSYIHSVLVLAKASGREREGGGGIRVG